MHYRGLPLPRRNRPGVGRVHPITEAYSSTLIVPKMSGEPAGCCSGTPEVKAVHGADFVTALIWPNLTCIERGLGPLADILSGKTGY